MSFENGDEACAPAEDERRALRYCKRAAGKARALATVVRSDPIHLLGIPILTFCFLAGAGVMAVLLSARTAVNHAKDDAGSLARCAAVQYSQQLLFAASPVEVFAAVVRANPSQYDRVAYRFNLTAPALLNTAPPGTVTSLRLLPSGRLRLSYPSNDKLIGLDVIANSAAGAGTARSQLYADALSVTGPVPPIKGQEAAGLSLLVRRAIYVPVNMSNPDDNFGRPDIPDPLCGDPCAYNETRGTVLWGFVTSVVSISALDGFVGQVDDNNSSSSSSSTTGFSSASRDQAFLTPAESALRALAGVGLAYRLTTRTGVVVAASGAAGELPKDVITAPVELAGLEWMLTVWRARGWQPAWVGGALAAVFVFAAVSSLLLAGMLVSRRRHAMLLEALLPRDLLKELNDTHAETLGPAGPLNGASSPAGLLLGLLGGLMAGAPPDLRQVVALRSLALRQADWYRPLGLVEAIQGAHLESDVARALMRQLGTGLDRSATRMEDGKDDAAADGVGLDASAANGAAAPIMAQRAGGGRHTDFALSSADEGDLFATSEAAAAAAATAGDLRGALAFVLSAAAAAGALPPLQPSASAVAALAPQGCVPASHGGGRGGGSVASAPLRWPSLPLGTAGAGAGLASHTSQLPPPPPPMLRLERPSSKSLARTAAANEAAVAATAAAAAAAAAAGGSGHSAAADPAALLDTATLLMASGNYDSVLLQSPAAAGQPPPPPQQQQQQPQQQQQSPRLSSQQAALVMRTQGSVSFAGGGMVMARTHNPPTPTRRGSSLLRTAPHAAVAVAALGPPQPGSGGGGNGGPLHGGGGGSGGGYRIVDTAGVTRQHPHQGSPGYQQGVTTRGLVIIPCSSSAESPRAGAAVPSPRQQQQQQQQLLPVAGLATSPWMACHDSAGGGAPSSGGAARSSPHQAALSEPLELLPAAAMASRAAAGGAGAAAGAGSGDGAGLPDTSETATRLATDAATAAAAATSALAALDGSSSLAADGASSLGNTGDWRLRQPSVRSTSNLSIHVAATATATAAAAATAPAGRAQQGSPDACGNLAGGHARETSHRLSPHATHLGVEGQGDARTASPQTSGSPLRPLPLRKSLLAALRQGMAGAVADRRSADATAGGPTTSAASGGANGANSMISRITSLARRSPAAGGRKANGRADGGGDHSGSGVRRRSHLCAQDEEGAVVGANAADAADLRCNGAQLLGTSPMLGAAVSTAAPQEPAVPTAAAAEVAACALPPPGAMLDQVELLLAGSGEWQYDTWALAEASGGHALSVMGFYLMQREGLVAAFKLQPTRLARLLRALEDGYPASNPYHNATHAADVLRTLSVLLRGARLTAHYAHGLGLLAAYFAAIIHDHGHPGLTNDFLVATSHPLALRYNDRSPLESHHAASAFTLLSERPYLDPFDQMAKEQRTALRKQAIDMVLATDMKQHFSLLTQFTALHKARKAGVSGGSGGVAGPGGGGDAGATGGGKGAVAAGDTPVSGPQQQPGPSPRQLRRPPNRRGAGEGFSSSHNVINENPSSSHALPQTHGLLHSDTPPVPEDEAERSLALQIALKAADIGHLAGALPVHCRWLGVLEEEFFRQGDQERARGLPVSPLFDRAKQGVSKSQVGFFDFVALPLVRALSDAFPGAAPLAACFERNYTHWKTVEAEAAAQLAAQQVAQQAAQHGVK